MTENIIKDIRKRCRLAMNGIVSANMRKMGLNYKLNFGVSLSKLKEIAAYYEADAILANSLWKEDVRELKILATMLYPAELFNMNEADRWLKEVPNQEIREQLCINLLQKLDFAGEMVTEWVNSNLQEYRITGYWLLARLLISKKATGGNTGISSFPHLLDDVTFENTSLRNASLLALKQLGRTSDNEARNIMVRINDFEHSGNEIKKEVYNSLKFEFDYYFNQN